MTEGRGQEAPRQVKLAGRAVATAVARAPWAWPLLRPVVRSFFDRSAPSWDERTGAGSVDHLATLAKAVTLVEPEPERVLDLGTGTGEAALFLAREFPRARIRGVDFSEEMVRLARAKVGLDPEGRIAFRVADAADLPWEEESFDLVAQVNLPPFFAETARVLRPGGHAIVVASRGEATPFFIPAAVLERGFRRAGLETIGSGEAGGGTWHVARKPRG